MVEGAWPRYDPQKLPVGCHPVQGVATPSGVVDAEESAQVPRSSLAGPLGRGCRVHETGVEARDPGVDAVDPAGRHTGASGMVVGPGEADGAKLAAVHVHRDVQTGTHPGHMPQTVFAHTERQVVQYHIGTQIGADSAQQRWAHDAGVGEATHHPVVRVVHRRWPQHRVPALVVPQFQTPTTEEATEKA